MPLNIKTFAWLSLITCSITYGDSSSLQDTSDFFIGCKKKGGLSVLSKQILDFRALSGGKTNRRLCIQNLKCSVPSEFTAPVVCQFDEIDGCEDTITCLVNLPKRPENSVSLALAENKSAVQKCKNNVGEHTLMASHKSDPDKYTAACIKDLTCTDKNGVVKNFPVVACSPLPQTKKSVHTDGKEYDFDVCPANDACLANQIELKNESDFIKQLADARKAAVAENSPRSSAVSSSNSPPVHRGKK